MKHGTSHEEWSDEARGAGWALAVAEEEDAATHRHRLHALVTKAFETEDLRALLERLTLVGQALLDWHDEIESEIAAGGRNTEAPPKPRPAMRAVAPSVEVRGVGHVDVVEVVAPAVHTWCGACSLCEQDTPPLDINPPKCPGCGASAIVACLRCGWRAVIPRPWREKTDALDNAGPSP